MVQRQARGVYGCVEVNMATDKGGWWCKRWADNDRVIDTRLEDKGWTASFGHELGAEVTKGI